MKPVQFAMIDGIDGSGKTTVFKLFKEELERKNRTCFDLVAEIKKSKRIPLFEELPPGEFIFSAEPTHAWVGAAIREEIIRKDANYGAEYAIDAFALDRAILYKRVLIGALKAGRKIIQDRGITTSLTYQSVQSLRPMRDILSRPGNVLAMSYPPDLFIHVDCPVEVAIRRIGAREKQDNAIFEQQTIMEANQAAFSSSEFWSLMPQSVIRYYFSTDCPLESVREEVKQLIKKFDNFPD